MYYVHACVFQGLTGKRGVKGPAGKHGDEVSIAKASFIYFFVL